MMPKTAKNKMSEWIQIRYWNRYVRNFLDEKNYFLKSEKVAGEVSRIFGIKNDNILKKIVERDRNVARRKWKKLNEKMRDWSRTSGVPADIILKHYLRGIFESKADFIHKMRFFLDIMKHFGTGRELEISLAVEAGRLDREYDNRKAVLVDRKARKQIGTKAEFDAPLTPISEFVEELNDAERRRRYRDRIFSDEDL